VQDFLFKKNKIVFYTTNYIFLPSKLFSISQKHFFYIINCKETCYGLKKKMNIGDFSDINNNFEGNGTNSVSVFSVERSISPSFFDDPESYLNFCTNIRGHEPSPSPVHFITHKQSRFISPPRFQDLFGKASKVNHFLK
jgi:hypothetical protein